jgi:hypothetical protein
MCVELLKRKKGDDGIGVMGVEFVNILERRDLKSEGSMALSTACHTDATFWKFNITLPPLFTLFGRSKAWIMVQKHISGTIMVNVDAIEPLLGISNGVKALYWAFFSAPLQHIPNIF